MSRLYALTADSDGNIILSDKSYQESQGRIIFSDEDHTRLTEMMNKLAPDSRVPGMADANTPETNADALHEFREVVRGPNGYGEEIAEPSQNLLES